MILKVGMTSYINALPFHLAFRHDLYSPDIQWHFAPPSELNHLLRKGILDVSLISSIEYLQGSYHFLSPFGIGAEGPIHSVNFYVKTWKNPMSCHLTSESATAVALLKILAKHFWDVSLVFDSQSNLPYDEHDSFLLIGNKALENQSFKGFTKFDLADKWKEFTGKNFVFAVLASREKSPSIDNFCQKLQESLFWSQNNFKQILDEALKMSSHSLSFLETYLRSHTYQLSEPFLEGLKHFEKLSHV